MSDQSTWFEVQLARERDRWVKLCRDRAEMWRRTADKPGAQTPLHEEARARANEAEFIADLIATDRADAPRVH
jgi:hypothetical protein